MNSHTQPPALDQLYKQVTAAICDAELADEDVAQAKWARVAELEQAIVAQFEDDRCYEARIARAGAAEAAAKAGQSPDGRPGHSLSTTRQLEPRITASNAFADSIQWGDYDTIGSSIRDCDIAATFATFLDAHGWGYFALCALKAHADTTACDPHAELLTLDMDDLDHDAASAILADRRADHLWALDPNDYPTEVACDTADRADLDRHAVPRWTPAH